MSPRIDRRTLWLLAPVVVLQGILLGVFTIRPMVARVWPIRNEPALDRSARLSYGPVFAEYVLFLRTMIPEDGTVVIPPPSVDVVLGHMGFMQYFLFPRRLTNCPEGEAWEDCRIHYGGRLTYLLSVAGFPPRDELGLDKIYIPFDERWGIYAPASHKGDGGRRDSGEEAADLAMRKASDLGDEDHGAVATAFSMAGLEPTLLNGNLLPRSRPV